MQIIFLWCRFFVHFHLKCFFWFFLVFLVNIGVFSCGKFAFFGWRFFLRVFRKRLNGEDWNYDGSWVKKREWVWIQRLKARQKLEENKEGSKNLPFCQKKRFLWVFIKKLSFGDSYDDQSAFFSFFRAFIK